MSEGKETPSGSLHAVVRRYRWACPRCGRTGEINMTEQDARRGLWLGLTQAIDTAHEKLFRETRRNDEEWCGCDQIDYTDEGPISA